ncbi:hypothetical protein SDC9_46814 [bioreactor metagenome]|uniref:Uncharacterized protein n=1 Tax=bioreactor metagenome TaxID=1076179 RepID=A0A644WAQ2_9ZZZZ
MTKYEASKRVLALLDMDADEIIDGIYQLAADLKRDDDEEEDDE